jgi:DNA-binding PadR family transcriptional regulator
VIGDYGASWTIHSRMSRPKGLNGTAAAVLAYLDTGPQSGWDIATGLQILIGEFWNITPSQVYRELRTMADQGLVTAGPAGARDRRPYNITAAGRDALSAWKDEPLERDVVRIPLLLRMFLEFTAQPDSRRLDRLVHQYRALHSQQLAGYETKLLEFVQAGLPEAHLVRYGLRHEQAILRWLDDFPKADTSKSAHHPTAQEPTSKRSRRSPA